MKSIAIKSDTGQWNKSNHFCVNCHCISTKEKHYPECTKPEAYAIPPTIEVPKRSASLRVWKRFIESHIHVKYVGNWTPPHHSKVWADGQV